MESKTICAEKGGYLPEPKDELENNFLDSLTSTTFYLGMTDSAVEGDWVWESDTTEVTWKNWVDWSNTNNDPPNGGTAENCAWMLKEVGKGLGGHSTKAWADSKCSGWDKEMSVVCEKGQDDSLVQCFDTKTTPKYYTRTQHKSLGRQVMQSSHQSNECGV